MGRQTIITRDAKAPGMDYCDPVRRRRSIEMPPTRPEIVACVGKVFTGDNAPTSDANPA